MWFQQSDKEILKEGATIKAPEIPEGSTLLRRAIIYSDSDDSIEEEELEAYVDKKDQEEEEEFDGTKVGLHEEGKGSFLVFIYYTCEVY